LNTATLDPGRKIHDWASAREWRRRTEGRVVFTNGVFDLLHPGHIDVLVGARRQGDALIVGVNSDASVRRLKGADRPVRTEVDRAYVLAALEMVDAVVIFDDDTPRDLIVELRPDVLVKGGDYDPEAIAGSSELRGWGGDVVIIPLRPGHSTTSIIQRLRGH
jgi:rfaE bifunctional protein nucleotidyltransferase chain/domain